MTAEKFQFANGLQPAETRDLVFKNLFYIQRWLDGAGPNADPASQQNLLRFRAATRHCPLIRKSYTFCKLTHEGVNDHTGS